MKGMSGKIIATVITLILAVFALILIWIFLSKSSLTITEAVDKIASGLVCKICTTIFKWGTQLLFCSGC